jgi:hypothetical protein
VRGPARVNLQPGSRLGPYEVVAPIGAGGMGEVYRARDTRLGREVAVKVLPSELSSDPDRLSRFEQEARSASALNHPNIVTVHDIGRADGVAYIAMELVEGKTLREVLLPGALSTKQILRIGVQAAEGLARAHSVGIVHRDLKPENLMIARDGLVKILDFGLAKLSMPESGVLSAAPTVARAQTQPGSVLGTVCYMSPEQASGQPVDFRSDQFSMGSILYEMAAGRKAFQRETAVDTLSAILHEDPAPIASINPQAPAPLRWIVERCLAKDPDERYASTRDLARELETVRDHLSEASVSGEAAIAVTRPRRSRSPVLLLFPVVLLGALYGAFLLGKGAGKTPPPSFRRLTFRGGTGQLGALCRGRPDHRLRRCVGEEPPRDLLEPSRQPRGTPPRIACRPPFRLLRRRNGRGGCSPQAPFRRRRHPRPRFGRRRRPPRNPSRRRLGRLVARRKSARHRP